MLTKALLLCTAVTSLLFISCSESTTPNTDVSFENKLILRATINGTVVTPGVITSNATDNAGTISITIQGTDLAEGTLDLKATVSGVGTYTLGGGSSTGSFHFGEFGVVEVTNFDTAADAVCTLVVDKIDKSLKRVKGRFSGRIKSSAGTEYEVKDGAFEGSW